MQDIDVTTIRRARWAVAVTFLMNGMIVGSWAPHIPLVKSRLELSEAGLGFVLLAMAAGAICAMPISGALCQRYGSAAVTRISAAIFCFSLLLPALAPNLLLLILALAVFGGLVGGKDVAMNIHAVVVERVYRHPVMSSFHGMFSLGGMLGAGLGFLLLGRVAPSTHLILVCAMAALAVIYIWPRLLPAGVDIGEAGAKFALPQRETWALGLLAFLVLICEGAMLDWSAVYLNEDLATSAGFASAGFAAFSGAMAVGRFAGDELRQRFGAVNLARVSAAIAALGFGGSLLIGTPGAAIVGFASVGLGLSNLIPLLFGAAGRQSNGSSSNNIAAVATLGYTGFLIGPPLIGFAAEISSLGMALGLVALACAIVSICASVTRSADD